MKRQGMTVTVNQLRELADDLEREVRELNVPHIPAKYNFDHKFQLNIINKTPEQSDTWEFE